MNRNLTTLLLGACTLSAVICDTVRANEGGRDLEAPDATAPDDFDRITKDYLRAKLSGQADGYYAAEILLLAGHEYLKKEYGISPEGGRSKPATVTKDQVTKADAAAKKVIPADEIDEMLTHFTVEATLVDKVGEFVVGGDGEEKKMFPAAAGDMVAVGRIGGSPDFMAFLFRKVGDDWKVVVEYLD